MAKAEDFLAAGAFLSVKDKLKNEGSADTISARAYRHPALGERPVVRLVADNLAAGDDLTMEFLGFAEPEVVGPVAKRQRQALGFPGWALINDPAHARYALELVKEFKKALRNAKSKPGHAYDDFVAISKRLGKGVAHFLPSFWEQVGREFLAFDNAAYASRAFGKAREAEKVHALKVDESTRQDAFLEFALGGAVSIKALADYGKELLSTHDPKAAWKFFRELCVRRTLGGMPPWASMFKDLQPLLKAGGLDQQQEIQSILVEIIDSPAISRAGMSFWDSISRPVAALVKRDNRVAGVLLNMIPQSPPSPQNHMWPWLQHLKSWSILENAWKDRVPEVARPNGGPAAWFQRMVRACDRLRQPVYDILTSMAPRLIQDQVPVQLYKKYARNNDQHFDIDLLDLALELKVPLADPTGEVSFHLLEWSGLSQYDTEAHDRPRDPVFVARENLYKVPLHASVHMIAGDPRFEATAMGKAGLKEIRRDWLLETINGLTTGALPQVEASLEDLAEKTTPATFQEFPEALEKLQQANILKSVSRTIRGGLMDEYGWPVLERVVEDFVKSSQQYPTIFGQFPNLIVTDGLKVIVLRGEEIIHEAELKLPASGKVKLLMFADGDLLVWSTSGYQSTCFWNSNPQPENPGYAFVIELGGFAIDVQGGGTFIGEKIIHRGDKGLLELHAIDRILADGTHWWIRVVETEPPDYVQVQRIYALDPVTGKRGRQSLPSFLEDFARDGAELDLVHCSLLPLGSVFPSSLLGTADGLIGFRSRRSASGVHRLEGVDGRSLDTSKATATSMLLDQAGSKGYIPVQMRAHGYGGPRLVGCVFWDPTGAYETSVIQGAGDSYSRGQVAHLTADYLHALQIRDLATSKKLRTITDLEVQKLLDAGQQDAANLEKTCSDAPVIRTPTAQNEWVNYPLLDAAIRQHFGAELPPRLLAGLRGVLVHSGQKTRQLAQLVQNRTADPTTLSTQVSTAADVEIDAYMKTFHYYYRELKNFTFMQGVAQAARFFSGNASSVRFPDCWFKVLQILSEGTPERLWSTFCANPASKYWIGFAEAWSDSPYLQLPGWFRGYTGESSNEKLFDVEIMALKAMNNIADSSDNQHYDLVIPYIGKSSRFLINKDYGGFDVLEYSPDGTFELIPELDVNEKTVIVTPPALWTKDSFRDFIKLTREQPLVFPPVEMLQSIAEEVRASAVEVASIWFGLPNSAIYAANFMPAHLREGCKLKAREYSSAKVSIGALPADTLKARLRSVIAGDPNDLWENPPTKVAGRLKAAWSGNQPERIPLSVEWVQKLGGAVGYGIDKHRLLQALNAPATHPFFSSEGVWKHVTGSYCLELACDDPRFEFDENIFRAATVSIAMLAYSLPVGDVARSKLAEVYAATMKALTNPGLLLRAAMRHESDPDKKAMLAPKVEALFGKPQKLEALLVADDGVAVAACNDESIQMAFRPAAVKTPAQYERLINQSNALHDLAGVAMNSRHHPAILNFQITRSPGFTELVARLKDTPVPHGSFEMNPLLSAMALVKKVVKANKLSEDAAAYYLQLLTLPDPTDKNVMLWNGWTAAKLKQAAEELLEKKLILEASRARAGRTYFLSGGWEDLKAPHLPIETWKLPLFQLRRDASQRIVPPLGCILPLEPVHTLFEKAWKRITEGDVPKYEEVN